MYYIQETDKPNFILKLFNIVKLKENKIILPIEAEEKMDLKKSKVLANKTKKILSKTNCNKVILSKEIKKQQDYQNYLYTYNFDDDFSTEYKKFDFPQAGTHIINGVQKDVKKENGKKEKISENVEVNLEEIYNARDKSKLYLLDKNELRILRNYPFAKEGYRFKDTELKEYFESQSWYEPSNYLSNEEISILKKDDDWFMYIKKYMEFSSYD